LDGRRAGLIAVELYKASLDLNVVVGRSVEESSGLIANIEIAWCSFLVEHSWRHVGRVNFSEERLILGNALDLGLQCCFVVLLVDLDCALAVGDGPRRHEKRVLVKFYF